MGIVRKPLFWIGTSRKDLKSFPEEVQKEIGRALDQAQRGEKSDLAKPLHGFHGASVLEIVSDFDTNAYRAVYTVRFHDAIYVLHCFQKKSKSGIATGNQNSDLIEKRLKIARGLHAEWLKGNVS